MERGGVLAQPSLRFFEPIKSSPVIRRFVKNQAARWSKVIRDANLSVR
jgi:hypothetical protein